MKDITKKDSQNKKCLKLPFISLPEGWFCTEAAGPGPFVTKATFKNPEGRTILWTSRHHRKHHFRLDISQGSTWWAPYAIGWWIGILFAIGATFFALGSFPGYSHVVGSTIDGITYFTGSLFFTTAAFLQYMETANAPQNMGFNGDKLRFLTWEPRRIGWWSVVVQLVGTLFFNLSTFAAIWQYLLVNQIDRLVWTPDVYGSICFLIASYLAWAEVSHAFWSLKPKSLPWWIAIFNLVGSVAFGVSAVAAYIIPSTGLPQNAILMNMGTLVGAICFFTGAVLLLPERTLSEIGNPNK